MAERGERGKGPRGAGGTPSFSMSNDTSTLNVIALVLIVISVCGRLLLRARQGPVIHYVPVAVRRPPGSRIVAAGAAPRSAAVATTTTTASSEVELTAGGMEEGCGVPCSQ